ncbi:MAG: SHOCT domain-containing protein [Lachnospiraceae bacterium]|nr:SHOCT domain-containing protein [Lachnospiraceae bacterium]
MEQNIVIKGTPQKNKPALIIIIVGVVMLLTSFIVASYVFENCEGYESFGFGYGGWYYWCVIYDFEFGDFFISEFFNFSCYYGYMIMLGVVALIVGIIMKLNTEKCEITVTNEAICGKLPRGKEVQIPLNQITAINRSSFNGISITSIGNVSNFHCIENQEEVMKAISFLLANSQQSSAQPAQSAPTVGSEAEQLKRLKDLLDAGVLTQEEFDAKKKQILGLLDLYFNIISSTGTPYGYIF